MPTLRYHSGFYSNIDGTEFDIYIDDTDYASTQNEFKVGANGFILEYEGQDDNIFERPMGSRVTIPFLVEEAADETFLESLIGAAEGRFKVRIDRGGNLYWVGFVVSDVTNFQDAYYPYEFNIVAVDGLARLKNIDYNNSGSAYTGKDTFLTHFSNVFGKLDFDYFHSSANFFETVLDWYEVQHSVVAGLDPLTVTRFDHSVFVHTDDHGETTYTSCYDVLKNFCTIWGARLYQSDGTWRFEQINTREVASFQEVRYDETFALIDYANTSYEATIDQNNYARLKGNHWSFWPALNKCCINYKHFHDANLIIGTTWDQANTSDYTMGNIDTSDGSVKLLFRAVLNYTNVHLDDTFWNPYVHVWRFKLKVGDYYLEHERYDPNNGVHSNTSGTIWTTTEKYYEVVSLIINPILQNDDTFNGSTIVQFETTALPTDATGDAVFSLSKFITVEASGTTTVASNDYTLTWDLSEHELHILADGDQASRENERQYCAEYGGTGSNTEELHSETVIGDGPYKSSFSKLEVYDGSNWQYSENWRVADIGSQFTIQYLTVREQISRQKAPLRKYIGTIDGNLTAQHRIYIDPHYLLFNGGRFIANHDRTIGTWLVISTEKTSINDAGTTIGGDVPIWIDVGLPDDEGLNENPGDVLAESTAAVVGSNLTDGPIDSGFTEEIPIEDADSALYQEGDIIVITDPTTGLSENITVATDMVAGDTSIQVFSVLENAYGSGSIIAPLGSDSEPDYQLSSEIVTGLFESGATISDEDFYIETTVKSSHLQYIEILQSGTLWSVFTPLNLFTVPPLLNGATIVSTYVAAAAAGTGSGNNTIVVKKNTSTVATINLAASVKTATDTTEIALATGDEIEYDITAVTASTAATGCNISHKITFEEVVEFQKLKYTLNRVIRDNLKLWYKFNRSAQVAISRGSILFDGTERIDCGTDPSTDITGNLTVMGWVRYDSFGSSSSIISKYTSSTGFILQNLGSSHEFTIDTNTSCGFSNSGKVVLYKWYHIAATWDGTNAKIYLDGVQQDTDNTYANPTTNAQQVQIGVYTDSTGILTGNLTKVGLWDAALTNDQINSVMNKRYTEFTTAEKADLVSWWELESIGDVTDSHGGNDGTINTI